MYYFKEGFCWSLINGTRSENDLKFRISPKSVNDVGGMSLSSIYPMVPEYLIVCLGNSNFFSRYTEAFVNFTVNFQVNDARQLPILIPDENLLKEFKKIFDQAIEVKKSDKNNENELLDIPRSLYKAASLRNVWFFVLTSMMLPG